jgi:hypothetical protein
LTGDPGRRTDTHVHLLFLDESGQLSERRFFALGGVALRDHEWHHVRDLWQETLAEHAWPLGKEIKWHGIRTGEVPPTLADAVVGMLARSPVRCYVVLLDIELGKEVAPAFFGTDEDTYATGLMFLAERFQLLLQAAEDVGMIVVDSRFREDDARLRRFSPISPRTAARIHGSTGSWKASSSGRATSRLAFSAPISSALSPPRRNAASGRRAAI